MLEAALAAGMLSEGADVVLAGVLPTPAVAFLVTELGARGGAVISASHNPATDNGIKFFDREAGKLADELELRIEQRVTSGASGPSSGRLGERRTFVDAGERYVEHALAALEGRSLKGRRVVLDCANGAASWTSPEAFRRAGADVVVINAQPDGLNINASCGSTDPSGCAAEVLRSGADLGLAHDGDADRVIAIDESGEVVDGDAMMATLALELKEREKLTGDVVVTTVMANLGFRVAMAASGIQLIETPVGDRYVLEAMRRGGAALGGEQSGHIIFPQFSTTGDGLITGLRLAGRMASTGQKLSELVSAIERFPQVLVNVKVGEPGRIQSSERIGLELENARRRLGGDGRVLVRPSGTEPLVRVMVEARDDSTARQIAEDLARLILEELGQDRVAST
jgi:phosphoglucosamine mutase